MTKCDPSDSESEDTCEVSSSEEVETAANDQPQRALEYEKQRLSRIAENKARLEALGLPNIVSSLKGLSQNVKNRKGKGKVEDDEDYRPGEGEARSGSSSEEEGSDEDDREDEDFVSSKSSRSRKRKVMNKGLKLKAGVSKHKHNSISYDIDDDEALRQAIALSLQDSAEGSFASDKHVVKVAQGERKGNIRNQDEKGRKKYKKSFSSRLQMTEDELILHFFQLDEAGKGSVSMRDLQRAAKAHDFLWTDKELADMISYFDSDADGKLSLEDFRKIVVRCNMTKGSEDY